MKAVGERKLGAGDARLSLSGLGQLVLPQPSPHSWAPHSWGPSQERARLEAEEQASFLDAPPGQSLAAKRCLLPSTVAMKSFFSPC